MSTSILVSISHHQNSSGHRRESTFGSRQFEFRNKCRTTKHFRVPSSDHNIRNRCTSYTFFTSDWKVRHIRCIRCSCSGCWWPPGATQQSEQRRRSCSEPSPPTNQIAYRHYRRWVARCPHDSAHARNPTPHLKNEASG